MVYRLLRQGLSKVAIGRELGLHPATVRKFANAATVEPLTAKNQQRSSVLDGYHEHLHRRWNDSIRNVTISPARRPRWATRAPSSRCNATCGDSAAALAKSRSRHRTRRRFATSPAGSCPTPTTSPARTPPTLRTIRERSNDLDRIAHHVEDFAVMMTRLDGHRLDSWISAAETDSLTAIAAFARNLRRDIDAVCNGLTLPHSCGPVGGYVNRSKMIKRQMFGRANLDLLRQRTLLQAD